MVLLVLTPSSGNTTLSTVIFFVLPQLPLIVGLVQLSHCQVKQRLLVDLLLQVDLGYLLQFSLLLLCFQLRGLGSWRITLVSFNIRIGYVILPLTLLLSGILLDLLEYVLPEVLLYFLDMLVFFIYSPIVCTIR